MPPLLLASSHINPKLLQLSFAVVVMVLVLVARLPTLLGLLGLLVLALGLGGLGLGGLGLRARLELVAIVLMRALRGGVGIAATMPFATTTLATLQ